MRQFSFDEALAARSHSANRRVVPAASVDAPAEWFLPNGDIYTGGFASNAPHGVGKYLWRDGCMYEGEWRRGKATGKGKFSWPSGATFEGEFKAGRMDGCGTFTGPGGETYCGSWVADRKQGFGRKHYANGDFYEGMWRKNLQEGRGRYLWQSGDQYIGEWKSGVISGRGVLIWANGSRFDSHWENGAPRGDGVFTWPNGCCYVDSDNQKGLLSPFDDGRIQFPSRKRSSVDGVSSRASVAERSFPKICIWESDGEAGDITCDIVDCVQASLYYRDGRGLDRGMMTAADVAAQRRRPCWLNEERKKPGQTISKGHKNYELMINLQKGISYSVGKSASSQLRELRRADFDPREKFWTRFPPDESKVVPSHQSVQFRWKDYCPMVFRHLRKLFAVDPTDYMLAICGNGSLRELSSPGKSGSFFYLTQDDRFMIKTVKKSEVKLLIKMLPSYYKHVSQHENSLLTKFFGVHCIKAVGSQKVRFIVMGNFFCSEYRIHRRFDLKGSSHGRTADKAEEEMDETTTFKDLDLNFVFRMQQFWYESFLRQIECDCQFLETEGIMDYSLLVGVHFCNDLPPEKIGMSPFASFNSRESLQEGKGTFKPYVCAEGFTADTIPSGRKPLIRLGVNIPAKAEKVTSDGDQCIMQLDPGESGSMPSRGSNVYEVVLHFGIIDILQGYDISKKLEHAYKSFQVDSSSISAVEPKLYSKRFRDFISRVFIEDT